MLDLSPSTGAVLEKVKPHRAMDDATRRSRILDAKLVRATPLVLIHWWWSDGGRDEPVSPSSTRRGSPSGQSTFPAITWFRETRRPRTTCRDGLENMGFSFGPISQSGSIFFATESKRVTFAVNQEGMGKWTATEVARSHFPSSPWISRKLRQFLSEL